MATFAAKQITYPEILSSVISSTVSTKGYVSLTGPTRTRIYVNATPTYDTTYFCYSLASPAATGAAPSVFAVGSDANGPYVTVLRAYTPAVGRILTFGKPVAVTAGLSSFFLRQAANINAGSLVVFNKGVASEDLKVAGSVDFTGSKITLATPVASNSPSIGSTTVQIGGINRNLTDSFSLVSNPVSVSTLSRDYLTFSDSNVAVRRKVVNSTNSISFGQTVTNQASLSAGASDTLSITDSVYGHANIQNISVNDSFSLGEFIQRIVTANVNEGFTFTENLALPPIKFTTPLVQVVPPILPETTGPAYRLFRHYAPTYRHVNVFLLNDGTFVQDYPTPENNNANVPYPWNWNEPNAPYATSTNWNGIITQYYLNPHISQVFWGGETSLVSQDLANALRHAGYGAYLEV